MVPYHFDTGEAIDKLQTGGFDKSQASAMVAVMVESQRELVTTADLELAVAKLNASHSDLKTEIADLRTELKTDFGNLRTEFADLKTELKTDFAALRADFAECQRAQMKMHLMSVLAISGIMGVLLAIVQIFG